MSDGRRATLLPLGRAPGAACRPEGGKRKTVRIHLALPESNEDTYPEFNYKEELAAAKKRGTVKKVKNIPNGLGLDPFDDDSDVQRIAQEMEAKYGMGVSSKKKRKGRRDDYADIGMGYDESDSFIDNTDGYDEMIPQNVTTLHGGFYINCGALEFKTDDEVSSEISSSSSDDERIPQNRSMKRVLQTSDESEGEKETEKSKNSEHTHKKIKLHNGTNGPKVMKKKLLSHDKIKHMKKKHSESRKKTVKEQLCDNNKQQQQPPPPQQQQPQQILLDDSHAVNSSNLLQLAIKSDNENDKERENRKPMSMSTVTDTIEAVVKGNNGNNNVISTTVEELRVKEENLFDNKNTITLLSSEGESSRDGKQEEVSVVKLPENLPNNILELINSIKDSASRSTEGKVKFLSGPVSELLLSLERQCKCLGKQSRLKVYEYLAPFVKCRKETLIKRAKNLVLEDEKNKLKIVLIKLRFIIESVMPPCIETYERESELILQRKIADPEEGKTLRLPRRRFPWTDESKKLVKEIVQLRKKCYLLEGKQKDTIDNLVEQFLKTELAVMWPDGWMSTSILMKISGCAPEPLKQPATTSGGSSNNNNNGDFNNKKSTVLLAAAANGSNNLVAKNVTLSSVKEIEQKLNNNPSLSITPVTAAAACGSNSSNKTSSNSTNNNSGSSVVSVKGGDIDIKISVSDGNNGGGGAKKTLPPRIEITKTSTTGGSVGGFGKHNQDSVKQEKCDIIGESSSRDSAKGRLRSITPETTIKPVKQSSNADELLLLLDEYNQQPQNLKIFKNATSGEKGGSEQKEKVVVVSEANHYPVIDLTDHSEYKRKSQNSHKSKSKAPSGEDVEKPPPKVRKEELTGSSALNQIIAESLGGGGDIFSGGGKVKESKHSNSIFGASNEGEEIQKVIEGLKNIHEMSSSPKKSSEGISTGSPVSVIAFNKSYAPKTSYSQSAAASASSTLTTASTNRNEYTKADFCTGFQDAFQKQLLGEHAAMKSATTAAMTAMLPPAAATTSKTNYNNSADKYPHVVTSGGSSSSLYAAAAAAAASGDKYLQNSNNNYTQPNTSKLKNNIPTQPPGSCELLNDMFINFLSEYGLPKPGVSHKSKSQQK